MNKLLKISFLLTFGILFFYSCQNENPRVVNPSNDATIKTIILIDTTENFHIIPADFTIDNENNLITNIDSIPYGTKVDSVFLRIQFASTAGYIVNKNSESYEKGRTLKAYDLTKPITITNFASDEKTKKEYTLKVNVHKIKTYEHVWTKLADEITSKANKNQVGFVLNDIFYFLYQTESNIKVSTSQNASEWKNLGVVQGLDLNVLLKNKVIHNGTIYLLSNNQLYQSNDVKNWTKTPINGDANYNYKSFLMFFKNQFWAIAQHKTNGIIKIANSTDGVDWEFAGKMSFNKNFPITDFAVTTFKPHLGREKMIVVGGKNSENKVLNTRWATENILGADSLNWVNLANSQSHFYGISKSTVIYYGSKLLLIGGFDNANELLDEEMELRNSVNEGLTWLPTDKNLNELPLEFGLRADICSFNYKNSLYLIGGVSEDNTYKSDVWKVRVNFYDFEDPSKY